MGKLIDLKGLGKATESKLNASSIYSIEDLLMCFPKVYKDQNIQSIENIKLKENVTIKAVVETRPNIFFFRKNLSKLSVNVNSGNQQFRVDIFNRHFMSKLLHPNIEIVITGQFKNSFKAFTANEMVLAKYYEEGIIPQYKLNDIPDGRMRKIVSQALSESHHITEDIPDFILDKRRILGINQVIRLIHHPKNYDELEHALYRLKYEELMRFGVRIELIKRQRFLKSYSRKQYQINLVKALIKTIGFELTQSQKDATNDIFRDLKSPHQMNRLLQGDVGSGKTIVAILAAYASVTAGYQVAVMAPTLVLSHQHYQVFSQYLDALGVRIKLLTSEVAKKERDQILDQIQNHQVDILIGTHALIQDDMMFSDLGFVIIDEQHRFGVEQRKKLRIKGRYPDLLLMSATPIPRSLAISIFESSDVSQITEKPKGRKTIRTKIVLDSDISVVFDRVVDEVEKKHQIYVICPLINENDDSAYYSVEETMSMFKNRFPQYHVAMLHGQMKDHEKMEVLTQFQRGNIQVLVSTTVIEVGIHVDAATTMVIMNANAFGLAQLHQLRGRIGRSDLQSYCYLLVNEGSEDEKRLQILEKEDDGFKISSYDLRLRGPGEVFGKHQAGIPHFNFANLIDDGELLKKALSDAKLLADSLDPLAEQLKKQVIQTIESYHLD